MNRQKALRALNPLLFALLLYQGVTGVFRFSFYDHFKLMHPVAGAVLLAAGAVHLFLNWPWIRANYRPGGRKA
jgi:hypothetical protein